MLPLVLNEDLPWCGGVDSGLNLGMEECTVFQRTRNLRLAFRFNKYAEQPESSFCYRFAVGIDPVPWV